MVHSEILTLIGLMIIASATPRLIPLFLFSKTQFPKSLQTWLGYVPIAIIAALLTSSIAVREGKINLTLENDYLIPSALILIVAVVTRSLAWTTLVGVCSMALIRNWPLF